MTTTTTEMTPFSTLVDAMRLSTDRYTATLPSDWLQGRTAYGGLSAALCLEAVTRKQDALPPLRSAQFCFFGPATGELTVDDRVLRRGKSTVLMGADLHGEDGLAARATFCFGASRASAHDHVALPMPDVPTPEDCPDFYTWPDQPNFMKHFEGRLAQGARSRSPGAPPEMTVWLRHRDKGDDNSLVRLLALADALPPAAMVLAKERTMISTMTWSIDMLDANPGTKNGWWLVRAEADTSREGYSAQSTVIWNPEGAPILLARQNVVIFG